MVILFWILLFAFAAFCGYVQGNYNEKHQDKGKKRLKEFARERYKRIESEAYSKYPGIGGQVIKRQEYIEKRLREE